MIQVRAPTPSPNSSRPRGVVLADTGSVAMKNAPSIAAPLVQWNSGEA